MRQAPPGTYKFAVGKGSAYKTLQVIGGKPPQDVRDIDLGWARINIKTRGGVLEIEYVHDIESNVGRREFTIGMGRGQIPLELADEAKAMGISGGELIQRAKAGEDVYALTGFERPADVPERISEKIPKSYIPKHLTQGFDSTSGYGNINVRDTDELDFPKKTRKIERKLREEEKVDTKKKARKNGDGEIADEFYFGRKIDSQDLGVAI